jgi:hypothetical protein
LSTTASPVSVDATLWPGEATCSALVGSGSAAAFDALVMVRAIDAREAKLAPPIALAACVRRIRYGSYRSVIADFRLTSSRRQADVK